MDSISRTLVESSVDGSTTFHVLKRDGSKATLDPETIRGDILRSCEGYPDVEGDLIAGKVVSGLHGGVSTRDIDLLSVQTAAALIAEDPQYARVAARLMSTYIGKEVANQGIASFTDSIRASYDQGLINDRVLSFVQFGATILNAAIDPSKDDEFEYFGLKTVYDRYLLKHPKTRLVTETPQYFFMRVACSLSHDYVEAVELYNTFSRLDYLPGSPTLFNAGTHREQMSSCYLLDSPLDDLAAIYDKYKDVALLSKFAGGIGLAYHRVRSQGSLIKGTNGYSNGIVPWLKTLDSSVSSVNQGGRRKGACAVYLETWHADVEAFLELKDNTGDGARRTYNLNLANWIPDLFMRRVKANGTWSLFDPKDVPTFPDLYGDEFDRAYEAAEKAGLAQKKVKARDLYTRMLRTLSETGNGWMTFKDPSNRKSNQTGLPGNVIHLSNLCVAPETMVLTRKGHEEIADLCDQEVEVWNGQEWSLVTIRKTGTDVELVRVLLSNGVTLDCTPQHRFAVEDGRFYSSKWKMVSAEDLQPGTRLAKFDFPSPEPDSAFSREHYAHGFFCGDGTYTSSGRPRTALYGVKKDLVEILDLDGTAKPDNSGRINVLYKLGGLPSKFQVPHQATVGEKLSWFAGLLDSDGCLALNGGNESLQIASINPEFLQGVRLMLITLGVDAKISLMREEGETLLPNGLGGSSFYPTQTIYRLLISSVDTFRLYTAGLRTRRLALSGYKPQRDARQFTRVVSVTREGRFSDTYCFTEPKLHLGTFNGVVTGQCTEILEITSDTDTAVCNLASVNLSRHMKDGVFDFDKLQATVTKAITHLDRVIDLNYYPVESTSRSNHKWRPVGLGLMGLQDVFFQMGLPFDAPEARTLSRDISEHIYFHALTASCDLAELHGAHPTFKDTRAAKGELQFDAWGVTPTLPGWDALRARIQKVGLRNSLLIAIAPTATIASIAGCYECIEPQTSNLFKRETLSGDFIQVNRYLVESLKKLGKWTESVRAKLKRADGSIHGIREIPTNLRAVYRTVWEIPQRSLIDMAADRGAFIDQGQSLNLFMEDPKMGQLSSMYMYAWEKGLKTTYYLRSRPATKIAKTTVETPDVEATPPAKVYTEEEALVCSLENPAACEACM